MPISPERLREFRFRYEEEFGELISEDEAREIASRLDVPCGLLFSLRDAHRT